MEFKITARVHKGAKFSEEEKKIAERFAHAINSELREFLKAAVLFGSAAKQTHPAAGSDIDVLLIIDDASILITPELTEAYRVIVENIARKTSLRLHINTLKVTNFWEHVRAGDPVIINVLREGVILVDKGFFRPIQALLDMGRIRPTRESIWVYYGRVPVSLKNARAHVLQACVDLYWAGIDASHAALMSVHAIPPSPDHVPAMLDEHLVRKGLLAKKYPTMLKELYTLSKGIEHREVRAVTGAQFDKHLAMTEELVEALRRVVREREHQHL